jgi:hypothetical protein
LLNTLDAVTPAELVDNVGVVVADVAAAPFLPFTPVLVEFVVRLDVTV